MARPPRRTHGSPKILIGTTLIVFLGGLLFLMFSPVPAPTHVIEKPIDNARFIQ